MSRPLYALTLWRPWSDAVTRGPKRIENRTWTPPEHIVGGHIALHAGKRYQQGGEGWSWPGGYVPPAEHRSPSGIVGVARVLGCLDARGRPRVVHPEDASAETIRRLWLLEDDPWWAGPVGWLLDDVTQLEPIAARGAQGLWQVPDALADLVRLHWKEARHRERAHLVRTPK